MMIYGFPCGMIVSFPDETMDRLPSTSLCEQRREENESSLEEAEGQVAAAGCVGECLSLATE